MVELLFCLETKKKGGGESSLSYSIPHKPILFSFTQCPCRQKEWSASNLNESNLFEVLIEVRRAGIMRENISFTPPDHVVLADVNIHFCFCFFFNKLVVWRCFIKLLSQRTFSLYRGNIMNQQATNYLCFSEINLDLNWRNPAPKFVFSVLWVEKLLVTGFLYCSDWKREPQTSP